MATESKPARAQVNLPTLPDGWSYGVTIEGPDAEKIQITAADKGKYDVALTVKDGAAQQAQEEDLKAALKTAGEAAKTVHRLAVQRKALAAEERKAAALLGKQPAPKQDAAPEPETTEQGEPPVPEPVVTGASGK